MAPNIDKVKKPDKTYYNIYIFGGGGGEGYLYS